MKSDKITIACLSVSRWIGFMKGEGSNSNFPNSKIKKPQILYYII